jgi:DNA-binding protein Fis
MLHQRSEPPGADEAGSTVLGQHGDWKWTSGFDSIRSMKKIVAFILPVSPEGAGTKPPIAAAANGPSNGDTERERILADGGMKVEATVSDERAQRIVASMLEQTEEGDDESNLERLLEKEIPIAGPEAQDLFKRIVIGVERELIGRVYSECNHVKTRAAARLGIDRNTLHKKLRQHHLADDEISDS